MQISKKQHGKIRFEQLQIRKVNIGSRHTRKLEKFSDHFNLIFKFFLSSYRCGILTFAGENVVVKFDINSYCGRGAFRRFEDGQFKIKAITSRHPNIAKAVIVSKKSWGLFLKQWSEGIREGSFTKKEILLEFSNRKIEIPVPFLQEFFNLIYKPY